MQLRKKLSAAAVGAAFAVGGGPALGAAGDIWTFQRVEVVNGMDARVAIVVETYDAAGGRVELRVNGGVFDVCPGGSETLRFSWTFQGDVRILSEGSSPSALITGEVAALDAPCTGYFAERSAITISGSGGITHALPDAEMQRVDTNRFHDAPSPLDLVRAYAMGERTSTTRAVYMSDFDPVPDRPLAYFSVRIEIHGGGELKYVYIFERGPRAVDTVKTPRP